jgi:hypothetical protein
MRAEVFKICGALLLSAINIIYTVKLIAEYGR